jgi:hypothetical protein
VPERNPLRRRLVALADELERRRVGLVATQRGEGISGEQRLREEVGALYGNVNGYEGRPTQSQLERMDVLDADLKAAEAAFQAAVTKVRALK